MIGGKFVYTYIVYISFFSIYVSAVCIYYRLCLSCRAIISADAHFQIAVAQNVGQKLGSNQKKKKKQKNSFMQDIF